MNEMTTSVNSSPAILDGLAKEAQYYATSFTNSILQLGRVLCEAKQLVEHGKWIDWVRDNTGFSTRTAQQFMSAYNRFGNNEKARQIGDRSKLIKMLALPAGAEDDFMDNNDVSAMSTREVDEAVRQVRAEMQAEIDEANAAREAAEKASLELPEEVQNELSGLRNDVARLTNTANDAVAAADVLRREKRALEKDLAEQEEMMAEAQVEREKLESDLLEAQKLIAKGDAERVPMNEFIRLTIGLRRLILSATMMRSCGRYRMPRIC